MKVLCNSGGMIVLYDKKVGRSIATSYIVVYWLSVKCISWWVR